jgi:hypothetical protein
MYLRTVYDLVGVADAIRDDDSHHSKGTRFVPHSFFTVRRPRWTGGIEGGVAGLGRRRRMFVMTWRGRFNHFCRCDQLNTTGDRFWRRQRQEESVRKRS